MKTLSPDTGVSDGSPAVACVPATASNSFQGVADAAAAAGIPELIPAPAPLAEGAMLICYLRAGRAVRGRGAVVGCYPNGSLRIQPARRGWRQVVVTPMEISAAGEVLVMPPKPRETSDPLPAPPAPVEHGYWRPLWRHLHAAYGLALEDDECRRIAKAVDAARGGRSPVGDAPCPPSSSVEFLRRYNRWRRGDETLTMEDPKSIGHALDSICDRVEELEEKHRTHHAEAERLTSVIRAATVLIAAKGRHNTMLAYEGLRAALASENDQVEQPALNQTS